MNRKGTDHSLLDWMMMIHLELEKINNNLENMNNNATDKQTVKKGKKSSGQDNGKSTVEN